jgi:hypothetical protein
VISSAYSIYQELGNPFDKRVILKFLSLGAFSLIYIKVASHSIFGFVAIISSEISQDLIFSNNSLNFKSFTKTQLIGDMHHHNT